MPMYLRKKTFMFRVENGFSLEHFCNSMMKTYIVNWQGYSFWEKISQLNETLQNFSPLNVLPYIVLPMVWVKLCMLCVDFSGLLAHFMQYSTWQIYSYRLCYGNQH